MVALGGGRGKWRVAAKWCRFSFGVMQNVLKLFVAMEVPL